MTATRRLLVLLALTVTAVLATGSTTANATFARSVALPATTVGTGTVPPPTNLVVTSACWTTTTTTTRVTTRDPLTGATSTRESSSSSAPVRSATDVESSVTSAPVAGPGPNETTTTTVTQDTEVRVSGSWTKSTTTRGVSRYDGNVHLLGGGAVWVGTTWVPWVTTMSGAFDAGLLWLQPRFSVSTVTPYGWTGQSTVSQVVGC